MFSNDTQKDDEPRLRDLLRPLKDPLKERWHLAALTIVAGWGKFVLPMGVPLLTGYLIDHVILQPAGPETRAIIYRLAVYSMCGIFTLAVATYFRSALAQELASHMQHTLRRKLFHHIQQLGMNFFHRQHAGSLGSRVSSDITHAGVVVDKGLIQLSMDGVSLITLFVVMMMNNVWLALLAFSLLGCNGLVVRKFGPKIRSGRKEIQERQSSVTGRAAEYFSAITLVKAYAGEEESGRNFSDYSETVRDLQVANSKLQGSFQSISNALLFSTQIILALVGSWMIVEYPGSLTAGSLVELLLFSSLINGSVQRLTDSLIQIQDGFAALERIHDILQLSATPKEPENPQYPALTGKMRFDHVDFGYTDKTVIFDFNFEFQSGKTYALVGKSGSGKSTLTQLVLRFFDPKKGQILLDDVPLPEISLAHFRSQVATVLQDPILFSTSVRENIGFASDNPDLETIQAAAKAAQAHDFILEMPKGYDSRVGERGVSLSGGQRQRVAIARALMRDPKILILDEATSALDSVTERSIQDVIEALRGTRTVIIVAHRLSTIRNVDEILVMSGGRLVEHGNFEALKNAGGHFSELLKDQKLDSEILSD
ncbi:MAG: ABC transporter ATP-binding protein [Verrucomicrobia bacterium]|nr:ABC transporter ATP-binding protein [Verrucomicrobiota bacterium]MCH8514642.1 ABC transporter ATP-binding protein/permease [Kiritimatiellia bacterium]